MTGIHGDINLSHEVATTIRRTMAAANPDSFLQAESNHDASRDLLGDGYRGAVNYAAFTRPLWQWLVPPQPRPYPHTKYPALPTLPGNLVAEAMRELSGVTPWMGTLHAMNLIGSHDTHRVASLLGDPGLVDVAFGMLAAFLRETPGETVLVHAARADHTEVRLPVRVVGTELTGLAGSPDLRADAGGWVTLPADGPTFGMWRC